MSYIGLSIGQFGLQDLEVPRIALMSSCFFFLILLFSFEKGIVRKEEIYIFSFLTVYLLLSAMRGDREGVWIGKIDGAILGGLFAFSSFRLGFYKYGERFFGIFLISSLIIFVITVFYKIHFGFWTREVRFFINGPITFAWIAGINSVISWYIYVKSGRKIFLSAMVVFIVAIVWTGSKGPLISVTLPIAYISFRYNKSSSLFLYAAAVLAILYVLISFELLPDRLLAITRIFSSDATATDQGSILSRSYMLDYSKELFLNNKLFGVGIGAWANGNIYMFVQNGDFLYPHNLTFELLSEHGIIGSVILLYILTMVFVSANPLGRAVFIFVFVSLQFSGDMSYWNYLLGIPLALNKDIWKNNET